MKMSAWMRGALVAVPSIIAIAATVSAVGAVVGVSQSDVNTDVPVAMSVQRYTVDGDDQRPSKPGADRAPATTTDGSYIQRGGDFVGGTSATSTRVQWPLKGKDQNLTDGFGPRVPPCPVCSSNHRGQDFSGTAGEPVAAIADGKVIEVVPRPGLSTFGAYVVLEHQLAGKKVHTVYAHLVSGSATVRVGDVVRVGDQIGQLGNTGASTGPHLHFEVIVDGVHVDPLAYLRKYADGKPVEIRTLPDVQWQDTPEGAPVDDAADGWKPPAATDPAQPTPTAPAESADPTAPSTTDPSETDPVATDPAMTDPATTTPKTPVPEATDPAAPTTEPVTPPADGSNTTTPTPVDAGTPTP